jgi:hypothetical protein
MSLLNMAATPLFVRRSLNRPIMTVITPPLTGGLWSATPHSLEVRKRIFKAKRLRQLHFGQWDDPVQVYLDFKRGKVKRSRRVASEIAQIKDRIQAKHTTTTEPTANAAPLPLAMGPVKARRLRIPSGFA